MSEYQYYEFQAIDEPLSDRQLQQIRKVSSRAELTNTSFFNEYHFGDFKGDPTQFLNKYYDAFFYYANWGTRQLMLRFPLGILDEEALAPYLCDELLETWTTKTHLIVHWLASDESGEWDINYEAQLGDYLPIRDELMRGDFRSLYIAWLYAASAEYVNADDLEPPVPAGLKKLTAAQKSLVAFFDVPKHLLSVAAEASVDIEPHDNENDQIESWVKKLSASEKNILLAKLLQNDRGAQAETLKRFRQDTAHRRKPSTITGARTMAELLSRKTTPRKDR